jgi:putative transposase
VKYAWLHEPPPAFAVRSVCRGLEVSRRGSSEWLGRPPRTHTDAAPQMAAQVPQDVAPGRGPSGTRRLKPLLAPEGLQASRRRSGRVLAHAGLGGTTRRNFTAPTGAGQAPTGAPHHRKRELTVHKPDTADVGDIPALPTGAGWRYLAVGLALCARAVGRWALADHLRAALVNQALSMAIGQRQPAAGLLMPTDRGSQDGAERYQQLLTRHGSEPSMSRKGNCWDHAVAESFFHPLKTARLSLEDFDTREQAQTAGFAYSEVFSNRQRCHAANGSLAPLLYEQA